VNALRTIRRARGKSLAVVAGLAGISPSYLSRLESGQRALERRSLIVALAAALDVAPSELSGSLLAIPGVATGAGVRTDVTAGHARRLKVNPRTRRHVGRPPTRPPSPGWWRR
jgi:transcriptional regulator with XRE-family HTH domain